MPLFYVQDDDRPLFVLARDFADAEAKYRMVIKRENDGDDFQYEPPKGINYVADDNDVVINEMPVGWCECCE